MTTPIKLNLKVYQGSTFREVLRWESSTKVYKPITGITKSAPVVVTAVGHNVPTGWRAKLTNIVGMTELNSSDTYHTITETTVDTITINAINAVGYKDYISGGIVEYNQPVSLNGYTARMQIREKLSSVEVIDTLTTENGKIIINDTDKTITILISAESTTLYNFNVAVYSVELVSITEVLPFIYGSIALEKEITR